VRQGQVLAARTRKEKKGHAKCLLLDEPFSARGRGKEEGPARTIRRRRGVRSPTGGAEREVTFDAPKKSCCRDQDTWHCRAQPVAALRKERKRKRAEGNVAPAIPNSTPASEGGKKKRGVNILGSRQNGRAGRTSANAHVRYNSDQKKKRGRQRLDRRKRKARLQGRDRPRRRPPWTKGGEA